MLWKYVVYIWFGMNTQNHLVIIMIRFISWGDFLNMTYFGGSVIKIITL